MFCTSCGEKTQKDTNFCTKCGSVKNELKSKKSRNLNIKTIKKPIIFVGVIIVLILLVVAGIGTDPYLEESDVSMLTLLQELEPTIQPLGYFDAPELYDSESISVEDWLSHFKYYDNVQHDTSDYYNTNPIFPNQKNILKSVVKLMCFDSEYGISFGSGLNDLSTGYILTNLHVVEGSEENGCLVGFPDPGTGTITEAYWGASIIDDDGENMHDLAYVSIEEPVVDENYDTYGYGHRVAEGSFPYFEQPDYCYDSSLNLGDKIFVIGYPYQSGYALTITDGLLSSLYSTSGYLVTSATIVSGNSGGLAIDEEGCYVGVPTAVYGGLTDDFLGEIIDAEFVDEFYTHIEDEFNEYQASLPIN